MKEPFADGASYRRFTDLLPNGLKVVTLEVPHLHSALASLYVRVGSRHEAPEVNGVTHFLEHVLFRGSRRFPDSLEVNGLIEDAGGSLNGMTLRDQCAFDTPIHPGGLSLALEVLSDMASAPLFQGVESERQIILEEMMDELDADGRDIDPSNLVMRLMFGAHPLGQKVAGTLENVRRLTEADLRAHHARFFGASSMVLAVAGPVERRKVLELAAANFSQIPMGQRPSEAPPVLLPRGPALDLCELSESQTEMILSFPIPPETHPDFPALSMMRAILDDGITSRLQRCVVETRALAYSVRCGMELFSDAGTFDVEAACTPANVLSVADAVLSLLQELIEVPVSEQELSRIIGRRRVALSFQADDLASLVSGLGAPELFRTPESFEASLAALSRVTPEEIQRVARKTFTQGSIHFCAVGPKIGRAKKPLLECIRRRLGRFEGRSRS